MGGRDKFRLFCFEASHRFFSQGLLFSASDRPGSPQAAFPLGNKLGNAEALFLENRGISVR